MSYHGSDRACVGPCPGGGYYLENSLTGSRECREECSGTELVFNDTRRCVPERQCYLYTNSADRTCVEQCAPGQFISNSSKIDGQSGELARLCQS